MPVVLLKTWRDLRHRSLRSLLTLLGIVIGVAGVVAIAATARNLASAQAVVYSSASQADISVSTGDLSPTIRNILERLPNVALVEARVILGTRIATTPDATRWVDLRFVGINDFDQIQVNQIELVAGQFPGPGEVALDSSARDFLHVQLGDLVWTRTRAADRPVARRLVGFTRTPATVDAAILNQVTGYALIGEVRKAAGLVGDNRLLFRLEDPAEAGTTANRIGRVLGSRGVQINFINVRNPEQAEGRRELATLLLLLTAFSALGVVLSGFLVANTVAAIMSEEMRQVGIMKSLGARRWQLISIYLLPAGLLGTVGMLIGLPLGIGGGALLGNFLAGLLSLRLPPPNLTTREPLLAVLVGLLIPLLAAVVPAWRGAGRSANTLLRSYGIAPIGSRRWLDWLLRPVGRLSALGLLALRASGRRPTRAAITILVIAISAAALLATQTLTNSVHGTIDRLYGMYAADAYLSLGQAATAHYTNDLERLPEVQHAEGWSRTGGFVGAQAVDLWGIPANTTLYHYRLLTGRWYSGQPREVVVSGALARNLNLQPAMLLTLDVGAERRPFTIVGVVDDESTYLGSTAAGKIFLTVDDISSLTHYGERVNLFAIALHQHDPAAVDAALTRIEYATRDRLTRAYAAYSDKASTLQAVQVLDLLLRAMVILIGLIGAAGIANTLILNLTERRRELGILRALGARSGQVIRLLITEGLLLGLLGAIPGIAVGIILARVLVDLTGTALFRLDFLLTPMALASTGGLVLVLALLASIGPGFLAARYRPAEALRYE